MAAHPGGQEHRHLVGQLTPTGKDPLLPAKDGAWRPDAAQLDRLLAAVGETDLRQRDPPLAGRNLSRHQGGSSRGPVAGALTLQLAADPEAVLRGLGTIRVSEGVRPPPGMTVSTRRVRGSLGSVRPRAVSRHPAVRPGCRGNPPGTGAQPGRSRSRRPAPPCGRPWRDSRRQRAARGSVTAPGAARWRCADG